MAVTVPRTDLEFLAVAPSPTEDENNSASSANPFDLSSIKPTVLPGAVTGVVPAGSWKRVVRSLGSNHTPGSARANKTAGEKEPVSLS